MIQCHLSHFHEKTSFRQSLDEGVYVKISLDNKGYVACPFCHYSGMLTRNREHINSGVCSKIDTMSLSHSHEVQVSILTRVVPATKDPLT